MVVFDVPVVQAHGAETRHRNCYQGCRVAGESHTKGEKNEDEVVGSIAAERMSQDLVSFFNNLQSDGVLDSQTGNRRSNFLNIFGPKWWAMQKMLMCWF
jgi:hypothetical protein